MTYTDAGTFHSPQQVAVTKYAHFLYSSLMWAVLMLILCSCTLHQKKVKDNNCNRVQSTQAGISETFQFKGIKLQTCSYLYILKSFHVLPNMIGQLPFVLAKKLKPCACGASRAKLWTRRQSQVPQVFRWSRWVERSPACEQQRLHQLVANDSSQEHQCLVP